MNWYYSVNTQTIGPLPDAEFRQFARVSGLRPETLVWKEGMSDWARLESVCPELFNSSSAGKGKKRVYKSDEDSPTPLPEGQHICAISGQAYPENEMIRFETLWVSQKHKNEYIHSITQGEDVPGTFKYAGFLMRGLALSIDQLILMIGGVSIFFALGGWHDSLSLFQEAQAGQEIHPQDIQTQFAAYWILSIVGTSVYYTFFTGRYNATPGKMVCGVKVVRANGNPIGYRLSFFRYLASVMSGAVFYLGYLTVLFDKEKRALHDYLCNTRVITRDQ